MLSANKLFEAVQERGFLWERATSFVVDFELCSLEGLYMDTKAISQTQKREKPKKHNITPLRKCILSSDKSIRLN